MNLRITLLAVILTGALAASAAKPISLRAQNAPAERAFIEAMRQAELNYVYPAGLLDTLTVSFDARRRPVKWVLDQMFRTAPLRYKIKGNTVTLTPAKPRNQFSAPLAPLKPKASTVYVPDSPAEGEALPELTVTGIDASADIHAQRHTVHHLDATSILRTPALLGESDAVKALQIEPGVSPGVEGFSGMHVHGGQNDGNLYLLDDVPMYQIYHVGGLFSAFNPDQIQRLDFYKSAFPTRFDGRLSSVVDVTAAPGDTTGHHGNLRVGLTSGSFNLHGPLGKRTTYSVGLRRSWLDVLTVPTCWFVNNFVTEAGDNKIQTRYAFTDLNLKVVHRLDARSTLTLSGYWGDDIFKVSNNMESQTVYDAANNRLRWGNIVGRLGWDYKYSPTLHLTTAASYTRYYSGCRIQSDWHTTDSLKSNWDISTSSARNSVDDYTLKTRLLWLPADGHRFSAGLSATGHRFQPNVGNSLSYTPADTVSVTEHISPLGAMTLHAYATDSWQLNPRLTVDAGLGLSYFRADGRGHFNLSPRLSAHYTLNDHVDMTAAYDRNVQYIRQLAQSYISLPTDQWLPVLGGSKPQTADQLSLSASWRPNAAWTLDGQMYYSWLHDIIEYRSNFYIDAVDMPTYRRIATGSGTAKGVDLKLTRNFGRLSGQLGYSLLWADRRFADRNYGRPYPARCDNRHKINLLLHWMISPKWEVTASWIGMSGNRITLPVQQWVGPDDSGNPLLSKYNNFRLPFYHRLDLNFTRHHSNGYWQFGLYNAYNRHNAVTVTQNGWIGNGKVQFQKLSLLPVIPSVSCTWLF